MKRYLAVIATVAVAVSASACATLTRGTTQQFVIETTPPGAAIKTSHGFTCPATPCTFSLPRKEGFTVVVTMEGYEMASAEVTTGMAGNGAAGMAGNILLGGLIGMGVDATSGAMNDLSPNPLQITLKPVAAPAAPAAVDPAAAPVAAAAGAAG